MGLFTLMACSEDSYQEADKMSETRSGTVENTEPQNSVKTVDLAIPYRSPYHMNNGPCCNQVEYVFINNSDLILEVSTAFGLAKYDGADDLKHFGWPMSPSSNYPTFFIYTTREYFEELYSTYKTIPPFSTQTSGPGAQVPIVGQNSFFTLGSFTVPSTTSEAKLLYEFGKAFGYHVFVRNPVTNIADTFVVRVPFLPSGITDPNQISNEWLPLVNATYPYGALWYNKKSLEICIGTNGEGNYGNFFNADSKYIFDDGNGQYYELKSTINSTQVILSLEKI